MLSGGLDSAVLAAQEARTYLVHPVYVAGGLAWEQGEQDIIRRLLSVPPLSNGSNPVMPLVRLEFSLRDVYPPTHWALKGTPPAYDTPDEDVYLHGRNIALLSKAAVYAASRKIAPGRRGAARRQSVSRCDAAVFRGAERGVLARPGRADGDQRAVLTSAQGGRGENRRRARRPVRAHALLYESVGHDTLRALQQVPRAEGRLSRGGCQRPDDLRERQPEIGRR